MMSAMPPSFASFREFYPYYLGEHRHPVSRRLHVVGTFASSLIIVISIATGRWALLPVALVVGYAFAWIGHFAFEKNRPATFRHPLYSLRGDFAMLRDVLLRRTRW